MPQIESVNFTLQDAKNADYDLERTFRNDKAQIQNKLAESIIERGGTTPYVDEFVFAMHGEDYEPYQPHNEYSDREGTFLTELGVSYRALEKRFGKCIGDTIAEFSDFGNGYRMLGVAPYSLQSMVARPPVSTSLRYSISKELRYDPSRRATEQYIGKVFMPLLTIGLDGRNKDQLSRLDVKVAKVVRPSDYTEGTFRLDRYNDSRAIGRPEICRRRRVGANAEMSNDITFLEELDRTQQVLYKAAHQAII